jgi:hypothetical protein
MKLYTSVLPILSVVHSVVEIPNDSGITGQEHDDTDVSRVFDHSPDPTINPYPGVTFKRFLCLSEVASIENIFFPRMTGPVLRSRSASGNFSNTL